MQVEVVVGVVGRAHGVRGEVNVEPRTDTPDRWFADQQVLDVQDAGRRLTVVASRWVQAAVPGGRRLLVRFAEADDRGTAEALRGLVLTARVDADERPTDDEEFYDRHLVGLAVVDHTGATRGRVTAVSHLPAQDLLEVDTPDGPRLVPFVQALVPEVDLAAGRVVLADLPGLLDDLDDTEGPADGKDDA